MAEPGRAGEYAGRGDYHRQLDPSWSYAPLYRRKLELVDGFMERLPSGARLLDVGCGEGVMVERYAARGYRAVGVDAHYRSDVVRQASLLSLPFEEESFDAVLCLDVLEHLPLGEQPLALREMHRVLAKRGELLLSVPNLAHLHSRLRFLISGRLTRTSSTDRHPGDRPVAEYLELLRECGFRVKGRKGVFPTVPFLFRVVNRKTDRYGWLVGLLDRLLPFPGFCFLNLIEAKK